MTIEKNVLVTNVSKSEFPELKNAEKTTNLEFKIVDGVLSVTGHANRLLKKGIDKDTGIVAEAIWLDKPFCLVGDVSEAIEFLVQWAFTRPAPDKVLDLEDEEGLIDLSSILLPKTGGKENNGWGIDLCEALASILTEAFDKEYNAADLQRRSKEGFSDASAKDYRAKFNKKNSPYHKYYQQAKADIAAVPEKATGDDV